MSLLEVIQTRSPSLVRVRVDTRCARFSLFPLRLGCTGMLFLNRTCLACKYDLAFWCTEKKGDVHSGGRTIRVADTHIFFFVAFFSPFSSPKIAGQIGAGLLKYLGCSPSDLACAQSKTADQVRNAEHNATMDVVLADGNEWLMTAGGVYRPTIDGDFFPGDFADLVRTGRYNRKANILWGTTRDEAAAFLPYVFPEPIPLDEKDKALAGYLLEDRTKKLFTSPAYALNKSDNDTIRSELSVAITDLLWACAVQRMSRGTASQHSKVYTYRMDHGRDIYSTFGEPFPPFCRGRVCHADDVIPSFGSGDVKDGTVQTGSDARFSRQVIDRFVTFAKTGNPNPKKKDSGLLGLAERNADVTSVQWPEYVDGEDRVFVFEETTGRVEVGKDTERCQWIEKNVHYDYQVHAPNGKSVPIFP